MTGRGREYASALFDVAREKGTLDLVYEELQCIRDAFNDNPEIRELLMSPSLSAAERMEISDRCFEGNVNEDLSAFLGVMAGKGHIRDLDECFEVFAEMYKEHAGKASAVIYTAVEPDEDTKARLLSRLMKLSGKTVNVEYRIDRSLIGGIVVEMDGTRLDGSLKRRLKDIKEVMEQ